ncbi:MAG: ABC transporter substrate-binding protein [Clostridia bacterium]|nr:ABC transporter substrate-binding protein [Clostridia bacterium]MBN2882651.1 ABC transporter substrate-binding protein [Clostridia bacterium]
MLKKVLVIVMCLSLLVGVFAACGDKAEEPGEVAGVIKIGVAAPITGNFAEYGKGFDVATQMAADKINAAGGINGKTLELVVMDSKGDAKEATDIARKFTEDSEIIGVVGDFSSTCCMATAPIYTEAKMVQLSPTASHPDYAGMSEYMFGVMGRQDAEGPFVAQYLAAKYLGAEKLAIIYLNNDWGVSAQSNIVKGADEIGLDIVALENFVDGEKDFTATLTKIRQTNPDTICLVMFYNEVSIIAKQIAQMGWDDVQICALGPGTSEQIIELGGADVEGIATSTPFYVTESDPVAWAFKTEFESKAGFTLNVHSACAYDAVMMMAKAIENLGDNASREAIAGELASMKDFVGITGPIIFTADGDVFRKYKIAQIEDGQWVQKTDYDYAD